MCKIDQDKHTVYFPDDGSSKVVDIKDLRIDSSSAPTRNDCLNKSFFFDGEPDLPEGRWKIRRVLHEKNEFVCTRLTGSGPNMEGFDVRYVMDCLQEEAEESRQNGPLWTPRGM